MKNVRYIREVQSPAHLKGSEGLTRLLDDGDAAQLVADGYVEIFGEQPYVAPELEVRLNGKRLVDVLSVSYVDSDGETKTWLKEIGDEPGLSDEVLYSQGIEDFGREADDEPGKGKS